MSDAFAGLAPCVHCGFCLQACPTYVATGDESDSPRGRIVLIRALASGGLKATDPGLTLHLDRCLGCRACEPVCPSGVAYGPALEAARHHITKERELPLLARAVLTVMVNPTIRRPTMLLARLMRPFAGWFAGRSRIGFAFGMLATTKPWQRGRGTEGQRSNGGRVAEGQRGSVVTVASADPPIPRSAVIFKGCIQRELFSHVNAATSRTLRVNGYQIVAAPGQGCCGALHAHAGLHDEAIRLARANVVALGAKPHAHVVVNAAGCGAIIKEYGDLLRGTDLEREAGGVAERTVDVSEALAAVGPRAGAPLALTAAYDHPCHLLHAQGVADPPRAVLKAVPQLDVVEHAGAESCCGSAGIYGLLNPELAVSILDGKIASIDSVEPDVVVTGNPGCMMQIGAGLLASDHSVPVAHPVELLDRSYRLAGFYQSAGLDFSIR